MLEMIENKLPMGWLHLYAPIKHYVKAKNLFRILKRIEIVDINTEHGVLDITVKNSNDELDQLIKDVKEKSADTCMVCGGIASVGVVQDGSNRVMCHNCAVKEANEKNCNIEWYSNSENEEMLISPKNED